MRRALSSHRFRPLIRVSQPCLGVPRTISSASYTRHRWTAPLGTQPCPWSARTLLRRLQHTQSGEASSTTEISRDKPIVRRLPLQCTGCGAFTQTTDPSQAGYFNLERKAVQEYLGLIELKTSKVDEVPEADKVVEKALSKLPPEQLEVLGLSKDDLIADRAAKKPKEGDPAEKPPLVCERCRELTHHHKAEPIFHPSVHSIAEIIHESPHKYNHVYHLVDAADFPMSLVPRLHSLLGDVNLRSQNRRSRREKFYGGRKIDMSFIITRSDLLAPKAEQVNSLMPYLRDVLRDALGRVGHRIRLGNVRCVSANRGWWTSELKKEIYARGGAGWMVGKANVGKSRLFNSVFPKGHMDAGEVKQSASAQNPLDPSEAAYMPIEASADLDVGEWLPPRRPETNYPAMPTVSALPGTTASPIRIPFGKGKGELIDLPGLARSDLEKYVQLEHRASLIMSRRIKPTQETLKPGKSLLLGGFIRITPRTPGVVFLAATFTPLKPHITSTEKAISIQKQEDGPAVENISVPGTGEKIACAGSFELSHDLTKQRAGPLTRSDALSLKPERLPFRVLAVDILIEGVGWVEVITQVRRRDYPHETPADTENKPATKEEGEDDAELANDHWEALDRAARGEKRGAAETQAPGTEPRWPVVDVFTPKGQFIGSRRPMGGYMMNKAKTKPAKNVRRSMKGAKKREKMAKRAARETASE